MPRVRAGSSASSDHRSACSGIAPTGAPAIGKPAAPGFDKPWEEEKTRRLAAARKPSEVREDADGANDVAASQSAGEAAESIQPAAPRAYKPRTEGSGNRPAFGGKPAFRGKPAFGGKPRFDGEGRPPRRDFAPREAGGDARPPRKTISKQKRIMAPT